MTLELIHGEEKDASEIRSQFILFRKLPYKRNASLD